MDIKKHLKTYMMNYPDSFVGFLWGVGGVLKELGQEWTEYGKQEWGDVFTKSGNQIFEVAASLAKLRDEYEIHQADPIKLVEDYKEVVLKNAKGK